MRWLGLAALVLTGCSLPTGFDGTPIDTGTTPAVGAPNANMV